ncbi:MAG TPA: hypothetical protein VGU64_14915, partial [Terriglobales bacterium]|nr:hypothetical protein [Terriglobales bacterium]
MAVSFKPTFGRLYGPFDAFGATDHDTLLQAPELMTIGAEQIFEKADSIAHRFRLSNLRMPAPYTPSRLQPISTATEAADKPDDELTINSN